MVSIRFIITLVAVALIAVSVIGVGWLAERNAQVALTDEAETRLLLEARNLAFLSSDALLSEFPELTLMRVVSEMHQERSDLAFVVVLDHEERIRGHADVRMLGERFELPSQLEETATHRQVSPSEHLYADDELLVARVAAAQADGDVLGYAIVGLHREHISSVLAHSRRQIIFFTAILLAVAVAVTLFVMTILLRPIGALRAGLERIGRGDLDAPMHLKDRTELGLLADTMDEMAAQLKASREEARAKEQEIVDTQKEVILTLGDVVEGRSRETANHIVRVGKSAHLLARLAGLDEDEADRVMLASPMHDVGKVGIPDAILNKRSKLTPTEYELIKTHTTIGYSFFKKSKRPILQAAAVIAHHHHERWDGGGYPRGLSGEDIHLYGRIVALVDVFDAVRSERCYKPAVSLPETVRILQEQRGRAFDPRLTDLFLEHIDRFEAIHREHSTGDVGHESIDAQELRRAA